MTAGGNGAGWEVDLRSWAGSFEVAARFACDERVVALFGPSGSGKSTLVEALAGVRPATGTARAGGAVLADARGARPAAARRVGWVPQDAALFPHLDVAGNLAFGARPEADRARIVAVLGLGGLLARRPDQLSGGERRRVALARALCAAPRVLLLDEPLSGIDLPRRARVFRHLLDVREAFALPILYVSHDPAEVLAIAGHVVLLEGGRVVGQGAPRALLGDAAALRFLDRLGFENVLRVAPIEAATPGHAVRVRTPGGRELIAPPPLAAGLGAGGWLAVRADDVLLAAELPHGLSARNALPGTVAAVEEAGAHLLVRVDAGDEWIATLTRRAVHELALAPGRPAWVVVKTHSMHWLAD